MAESARKKYRRDMKRYLKQANDNLEWAIKHMAQIEMGAKSALNLPDDGSPLTDEQLQQTPVNWQQLIRNVRAIGAALMEVQSLLQKQIENV